MADYQMSLKLGNKIIRIPVLPEKLAVKSPGKNETATVLEMGEINIIRKRGLREISWSGLFPLHAAPYVTDRIQLDPMTYINDIQDFRKRKKPGRLSIYGTDLDINMQVGIESFEYYERAGEVGDIYYSITLKEWKDYSAVSVRSRLRRPPRRKPRRKRGREPRPSKRRIPLSQVIAFGP